MTIRVLLADDDLEAGRILERLLNTDPGLRVVGRAGGADEAVSLATKLHPDVAVLDVHMPGGGPQAAHRIRASLPGTRVIALSASDERESVLDMLRSGATGYLLKGTLGDEILASIHRCARGETVLSPSLAPAIVDELLERLPDRDATAERRVLDVIGSVSIVHQPIVDLESRHVLGVEALARFPQGTPDEWFGFAAEAGVLTELELACLRAALHVEVPEGVYHSVNVSPQTILAPGFAEALAGCRPDRTVLEITEHTAVEDYDALEAALIPLRARGLRLAIDDAGAGFSNLKHILRLTPDFIKIDHALTSGIDKDLHRRALASAMLSFSVAIGAGVIAEGIETEEELDTLLDLGIRTGQGYHLGRPAAIHVQQVRSRELLARLG